MIRLSYSPFLRLQGPQYLSLLYPFLIMVSNNNNKKQMQGQNLSFSYFISNIKIQALPQKIDKNPFNHYAFQ